MLGDGGGGERGLSGGGDQSGGAWAGGVWAADWRGSQ